MAICLKLALHDTFCSQLNCILKWDWCHPSLAVWQASGKRMMLSSLSSFVVFPLPLLPGVSENSLLQLCGLHGCWCLKGNIQFASEYFFVFVSFQYEHYKIYSNPWVWTWDCQWGDYMGSGLYLANNKLLFIYLFYWESLHILIRDHRSNAIIKDNWGFL